jgi:hypothetical protein
MQHHERGDEQDLNAAPPVLGVVIVALVSAAALAGWVDVPLPLPTLTALTATQPT